VPETIPDLWPPDFGVSGPLPPVAILRGQAAALHERTKGLVMGDVRNVSETPGRFLYAFDLVAPALDDYRYTLFVIDHDINLYPVELLARRIRPEPYRAATPEQFESVLKEVLARDETLGVVPSLIAQSTA
jgi:hypothetical protein